MGKSGVVKLPKGPQVAKVQRTTFTKGPNGKMVRSDTVVDGEVKSKPVSPPLKLKDGVVVAGDQSAPRKNVVVKSALPVKHEIDRNTGAVIETQGKKSKLL